MQQRIVQLSRKAILDPDERVDCATGEPAPELYDHARFLFHRLFANYREKFGQDYMPDLLLGGVQEKM